MDFTPVNMLSICSGYGGLDLGVKMAIPGARAVCYVEREAAAACLLGDRMASSDLDPAPIWTDLRTFDGVAWRGVVDLVVAGIPCQPYSVAGKQRGESDKRDLVSHFVRVVGECLPAMVFVEEVPSFVGHWRAGSVPGFARLAIGLSALAYRVEEPVLVRAEDVGAPHRRERAFMLAHRHRHRQQEQWGGGVFDGKRKTCGYDADGRGETMADAERRGLRDKPRRGGGADWQKTPVTVNNRETWPPGPHDDWSSWRGPKPAIRRGAYGTINRVHRLRMLGNGVVPQQAALAFKTLIERIKICG